MSPLLWLETLSKDIRCLVVGTDVSDADVVSSEVFRQTSEVNFMCPRDMAQLRAIAFLDNQDSCLVVLAHFTET